MDLFSLEKGLELLLSLAVIEDDDALQITALSALLKLAQQDGNEILFLCLSNIMKGIREEQL